MPSHHKVKNTVGKENVKTAAVNLVVKVAMNLMWNSCDATLEPESTRKQKNYWTRQEVCLKKLKKMEKTGQKPWENLVVVKRVRNLKEEQHWPKKSSEEGTQQPTRT